MVSFADNSDPSSGVARGGTLPLLAPPPQMKLHFVQRSMESRHFESHQSVPLLTPQPPLPPPHFEKSGYAADPSRER